MNWAEEDWCGKSKIAFVLSVIGTIATTFISSSAIAQIAPDGTLGRESSVVTPINPQNDRIDGGAIRGSNLFHSFQDFNIGDGRGAYFANPIGIDTILSRVTGSNPSNILGTLGVLGNANLYLLNPNGIFFGANARLDIRGSFVASTAAGIEFSDRSLYTATNPTAQPLLTVAVPIGLQYGTQPAGTITNAGNLTVGQGQKLAFVGGLVTSTGQLTASGGEVQVLGDRVGLLDNARIDVSSDTGGGTVLIGGDYQGKGAVPTADRTFIDADVTINADALTSGNGGRVIVWADEVTGFYGNISARGGANAGNGGFVEVSGKQSLIFEGTVDTSATRGNFGTLLLDPTDIRITASGAGGNVTGNPSGGLGQVLFGDVGPTTITQNQLQGLPGNTNVILQATNSIVIDPLGATPADPGTLTFNPGTGTIAFQAGGAISMNSIDTIATRGRSISIEGANLLLGSIDTSNRPSAGGDIRLLATNGSIRTSTLSSDSLSTNGSSAKGGNVAINAVNGSVEIRGGSNNFIGAIHTNSFIRGTVPSIAGNTSDGGTVAITATGNITVANITNSQSAAINTQAVNRGVGSAGTAGDVRLTTSNGSINITGSILANSRANSGNFGNGGAVTLIADSGDILAMGEIASQSLASGISGSAKDIILKAPNGRISVTGVIRANSLSDLRNAGNGGRVELSAKNGITTGSEIVTYSQGSGKGGDISIISRDGSIDTSVGFLNSGSNSGDAGTVTFNAASDITTGSIFSGSVSGTGGDIKLISSNGIINTSAGILDASSVPNSGIPTGNGGNVTIQTNGDIFSGAIVTAGLLGGSITLTSGETLSINNVDIGSGTISTDPGQSGNIELNARTIDLTSARVGTFTLGAARAGDVIVGTTGTEAITITDAVIGSVALGEGDSGNIGVTGNQVNILNTGVSSTPRNQIFDLFLVNIPDGSGIATTTRTGGDSGSIFIATNQLHVQDASPTNSDPTNNELTGISTATLLESTTGNAGAITINATERVKIEGDNPNAFIDPTPASQKLAEDVQNIQTGITSATVGKGNAGSVTINTDQFEIRDGAAITVGVTNLGTGNGGELIINANSVKVENRAAIATATRSQVATPTSGNAGNLTVRARQQVNLSNGALIAADSTGAGKAGDLLIEAEELNLSDNSRVGSATYTTGQGGNIRITIGDNIIFSNNSEITSEALNTANGGNLNISAGGVIFSPSLADNNDVFVTAQQGQGGTITATATGIFSFRQFNGDRTPESDFTATALSGQNGTVTPVDQNPQAPPPTQPTVREIPQVCPASQGVETRQAGSSAFINTGRGGLPPNPNEMLDSHTAQVPWVSLDPNEQTSSNSSNSGTAMRATPDAIREAQGWMRLPGDKVRLTSNTSDLTHIPCIVRGNP